MSYETNAIGALQMYEKRLSSLTKEISQTIFESEAGRSEEAEALLKIVHIQEEVVEINNCLLVLRALLGRG